MFLLRTLAVLLGILAIARARNYPAGCPSMKPQSGFEMSRFLGTWYVIQSRSPARRCSNISYTDGVLRERYIFTPNAIDNPPVGSRAGIYESSPGVLQIYFPTERKTIAYELVSGDLQVVLPTAVVQTVFATDYKTYAGTLFCPRLVPCECSGLIISRTKELNETIIEELREELRNASVDLSELENVPQTDCEELEESSGFWEKLKVSLQLIALWIRLIY